MGCDEEAARERPAAEGAEEAITPNGRVILVFGSPGSGKDTQCERLVDKYGCAHLSATDQLRAAVTSASSQGVMISNMIRAGQIVPAQVSLDLLKAAMRERAGPYLVQGYPKTADQLDAFERQCGSCTAALLLEGGEDELTARLLARGKTSNRTDDTAEVISRRFRTFELQSMPVVDLLRARGALRVVDATQSEDAVFAAACAAYEQLVQ